MNSTAPTAALGLEYEASIERLAELLADKIAKRLESRMPPDVLTAEQIAREYRVSVGWVYAHKLELAGTPVGRGPRPRWRFTREGVESHFRACAETRVSSPAATEEKPPWRRSLV